MADANRATQYSFTHSDPVLLQRLAPLLQGAVVTAWYSVVESPEENQTSRKVRFKLPFLSTSNVTVCPLAPLQADPSLAQPRRRLPCRSRLSIAARPNKTPPASLIVASSRWRMGCAGRQPVPEWTCVRC